jgi:GntR family transcriptional regulator/MocR family aminotransferase
MSIARRLALLEWAAKASAWVIEDDYDSEFRHASQPLPALQGLDRQQRVIYIGSFSKVLFPSLRLGYLVVPPNLVEPLTTAKAGIDRHAISIDQAVLTDFMDEGHFARHIRRMRVLYAERHDTLIHAARGELSEWLEVSTGEAGMHVVGWLRNDIDDKHACEQAAIRGIVTMPLSSFCLERPRRGGLILGYASIGARQIREGVQALAAALRSTVRKPSASRTAKKLR